LKIECIGYFPLENKLNVLGIFHLKIDCIGYLPLEN